MSKESYEGSYKKHAIYIFRDQDTGDWYIQVVAPNGTFAYDGWWASSEDKTIDQAIAEAKDGAQL
jgi:uncharacterized protein (DUF2461 family)